MSVLKTTVRRVRAATRRALGRDVRFPVQARTRLARHGSDAGEWWVCPDGLDAGCTVYSLGIGTDITFDLSLIEAYGLTVHAFDPTPGALAFVSGQKVPAGLVCHPVS